ncbi:RNaseH domain-containing protein [Dactylosporangium sp. NPDC000521]|uniref:RNaseH domain-containing protein n=1 Tax=Dactylosporangium sp. NPDC000521 TaxID=3363975 RepID=UPI0036BF69CD
MRYDLIQELAFPLDPERLTGLLQPYHTCTFPSSWKAAIGEFLNPGASTGPRSIPLRDLTTAFSTFQPEVIVNDARGDNQLWLGAASRPDDTALTALIHSGIVTTAHTWAKRYPRRQIQLDRLPDLLAGIDPTADLSWTTTDPVPRPGETAGDPVFRLLPDLLAAQLVNDDFAVDHGGVTTSRFQRITTDRGAELVSWPPHYHPRRKRRWPWSYVIGLTVQTYPDNPVPHLFVRIGLRRYASGKIFLKNYKRALSVAVKAPAPWYDGATPPMFARASMKWRPGAYGRKEGFWDWSDDIVAVLQRFHSGVALPAPADLASDALRHIPELPAYEAGYETAVFYRTGFKDKHPVGDGASAKDRWRIFEALRGALDEHLRPVEPTARVLGMSAPARPPAKKNGLHIDTRQVAAALGREVAFEMWWQTTVIRDETLARLTDVLQMPTLTPAADGESWTTENDDLCLTVRTRALAERDLAGKLAVDSTIMKKADRIRAAATARIGQIRDWVEPSRTAQPILVMVELDDGDAFTDEDDPKFATRVGAGRIGRNTQFLVPYSATETASSRRIRIEQSLRELFVRHAGLPARRMQLGLDDEPLPANTRVVGLWLVRKNIPQTAAYPIAVCCDPSQPVTKVRLPGDRTWLPMHQALLRLTKLQGDDALLDSKAVTMFIDDLLEQLNNLDGPTLLLSHSQNLRGMWSNTSNGRLRLDDLSTNIREQVPASTYRNIRFVRVRTNLGNETPQHFALDEGKGENDNGELEKTSLIGLSAGLWRPASAHHRLFFSTPDKPATASKTSPKGSRVEPRIKKSKDKPDVEILDIGAEVWNPQLVEYFVAALQTGDKPESWAAAAHQFRYAAAHFDDPTLLALPLHLARKAGEYLLPAYQIDSKITETEG